MDMIHDIPRTFVLTVKPTWHKWEMTRDHLKQHGIESEPFLGLDNKQCRLRPEYTFDVNVPGERIGAEQTCACLSHYLVWKVLSYLPEDVFWVLEDDAQLTDNWRQDYTQAMAVLPDDWDIVFIGSCCTNNLTKYYIGNNLFNVQWPMCGHALQIRKKALPVLLERNQKVWAPLDIALKLDCLPYLNVYTILPAIVLQRGQTLPV